MDFFGAQERARRATTWLLLLYAAAVACIFAATYLAVSAGFAAYDSFADVPPADASAWFSLDRAFWTLLITLGVVGFSALSKHAALQRGGEQVCAELGALRVDVSTRRRLERRLLNVVEEMAIAAGTPVPAVYVLEHEQGINAFAAGYRLEDAALAVTQGTLESLSRDELQAVVAHEFSHILNGDMRLNTRLIAALHGILALTIFARLLASAFARSTERKDDDDSGWKIRSSSSSSSSDSGKSGGGGGGLALVLAILIAIVLITIVGAIGAFFARLIQAAICRQRELLADAQAVQLTRDEEQVRRALRRVQEDAVGSLLLSHRASSVAHMFFAEGVSGWLKSHPPLAQRITQLGPSSVDPPLPQVCNPSGAVSAPAPAPLRSVIGTLSRVNLDYAVDLLQQLPSRVKAALEDPVAAEALVYLLLLHQDATQRQRQWQELSQSADPDVIASMVELRADLTAVESQHRLPLLELALPAIKALGSQERTRFLRQVDRLIASDDTTELFELVVQCILHFRLADAAHAVPSVPKKRQRRQAASVLLTLLVCVQGGDEKSQGQLLRNLSFDAGYDPPLELDLKAASEPDAVQNALQVLRAARPKSQRRLLEACESIMLADGALQLDECELFRAIVVSLGAPLPAQAVQPVATAPR